MNLKKIIPIIAISLYAYLVGDWIVEGNYFLILITSLPVFVFVAIELVSKGSHSKAYSTRVVESPAYVRNRVIHRLVLILIFAIIGLNVIAQADPTVFQRLLASLILLLGFIPTFLYIKKDESGIPFLPIFGAIYSIYYSLPIFLLEEYTIKLTPLPQDSLDKALLLAAVGLIMLLLSYYKLPGKSIGRYLPRISIYLNPQKAKFWAIILGFFGLGISYLILIIHIPAQFGQIVLLLAQFSIIAIGILFILQLQGRLNRAGKLILWGVFLSLLLMLRLGTGAIAELLLIIIFMLLTYWCFRRKIPWKAAVGGVLLIIVLLGVRGEFRELTWGGIYAGKSPIEKSMFFAEMAFADRESPYLGYKFATTRLAHILPFAHVVDLTPKTVPYWMGKTYQTLLWMPIPRIIYPDKPTKVLGQTFGHRYGLLHHSDYTTSYNFPQLVEMYANFGVMGVIIGMFIIGIIYRAIYEMLCHPKAGEGGILIGLFIFMGLVNIESDFSLVFGAVIYHIILLAIIMRLIRSRSRV